MRNDPTTVSGGSTSPAVSPGSPAITNHRHDRSPIVTSQGWIWPPHFAAGAFLQRLLQLRVLRIDRLAPSKNEIIVDAIEEATRWSSGGPCAPSVDSTRMDSRPPIVPLDWTPASQPREATPLVRWSWSCSMDDGYAQQLESRGVSVGVGGCCCGTSGGGRPGRNSVRSANPGLLVAASIPHTFHARHTGAARHDQRQRPVLGRRREEDVRDRARPHRLERKSPGRGAGRYREALSSLSARASR